MKMKRLTRIICIALILIMILSLAACGGGGSSSKPSTEGNTQGLQEETEENTTPKPNATGNKQDLPEQTEENTLDYNFIDRYFGIKAEYDSYDSPYIHTLNETVERLYFGNENDYPNIDRSNAIPVDKGKTGGIMLYWDSEGNAYCLSKDIIYIATLRTTSTNWKTNIKELVLDNCSTKYWEQIDPMTHEKSMRGLFVGFFALERIDISSFDTSEITDMDTMFNRCKNLKELDLSGFDTSRVTNMSCMFAGCDSLTYLDLSSFDTSSVASSLDMFTGCDAEVITGDKWTLGNP